MRTKGRRRLDLMLIAGGSLVTGGIAVFGGAVYNEERIDRMWVGAAVDVDGTAALHEVIDYNFGTTTDRHGLLRRIPGLLPSEPLLADSPDGAPDGISSMVPWTDPEGIVGSEIKVGDADVTVSGRHRYILDYRLSTLTRGDEVAFNGVGPGWEVAVESSHVELVAPFELDDVTCNKGRRGSTATCEAEQVAPGHVVVDMGKLEKLNGFTIYATRGADLAARPELAPPPASAPDDEGAGLAEPGAIALVAALGGGLATSRAVRRAGRERVGSMAGAGTPTDAAYATGGSEQLVDAEDLADYATTELAPPEGITAPMGGIIQAEAVQVNHKVAWLIEAAIDGVIDLEEEGGKVTTIERLAPGDADQKVVLDLAFGGRSQVVLGKYDPTFASGWSHLDTILQRWSTESGLWDAAADKRKTRIRVLGGLFGIVALVLTGIGGALSARHDPAWLALVALSGLAAGVGWSAMVRGWELRVRTPRGSALWLRVESFRRFLHESEGYHAEEAAKRGVLREYTAWAVSIGELDRWSKAVSSSSVIPESSGLGYVFLASSLGSSVSSTSTAPSSSSGSGGGGGGSGGGGGGGGGGSW